MHADDFFSSGAVFDYTFGYPQPELSFTTIEAVPLSQNALFQHTSKLGDTLVPPSPLFRDSSCSPVPSSITSLSSDDTVSDYFILPSEHPAKRLKIQAEQVTPPRPAVKCIKPALPRPSSTQRRISSVRPVAVQPRRYRAILPAPPRSEIQPSGQSPQRPGVLAPQAKSSQSVKPKSEAPVFRHLPTNLPPMRYPKGQDSPFRPERNQGTIPGSMLDTLPLLEARFDRLEAAISEYAKSRYDLALRNSLIEGLEPDY